MFTVTYHKLLISAVKKKVIHKKWWCSEILHLAKCDAAGLLLDLDVWKYKHLCFNCIAQAPFFIYFIAIAK